MYIPSYTSPYTSYTSFKNNELSLKQKIYTYQYTLHILPHILSYTSFLIRNESSSKEAHQSTPRGPSWLITLRRHLKAVFVPTEVPKRPIKGYNFVTEFRKLFSRFFNSTNAPRGHSGVITLRRKLETHFTTEKDSKTNQEL